jgi:PAS domain S-box-containing protein
MAGLDSADHLDTSSPEELRQRLRALEALVARTPVPIAIAHDRECRFISANAALAALLGLPPGANVSLTPPPGEAPLYRIQHDGRDVPPDELPMQYAIAHRTTIRNDIEIVRADGTVRFVQNDVAPLYDANDEVCGCVSVCVDLTDRKRLENSLRTFEFLVENTNEFIAMCALDYKPFYVNRAGLRMVGLESLDGARETTMLDWFFPDDRPRIEHEFFPQVLREGHGEIEARFRHLTTGEAIWMNCSVLALTDPQGRPTGLATISLNITERKRAEDALREADRRKDEFLATLSHELRNPLAPIRNAIELMRLAAEDPAMMGHARAIMERQLLQLVRITDDLLDMSRVTRDKVELRRERIDLRTVLQAAIEATRPMIDSHGHTLTLELPAGPLWLDADFTRLTQAFANLLNNAAKYTERGGKIWLRAAAEGDLAVVTVTDTGIGIPPELLPQIFDMFTQLDQSLHRSHGGLGIGLTLVKRLIELHGGSVDARSGGPGQGSTFTVRLPISAPPALEAPRPAAPPARSGCRILIAEDSADAAEMLRLMLTYMGHDVRVTSDGIQAVAMAKEFAPQIALLDIGMPRMDGYEAARRIREALGRAVILVALTGWGQDEDKRQSREAGFDHHFTKPVEPDVLQELIGSCS